MKPFPVPVRPFGPGSQPPEDVELDILSMPRDVSAFSMPRVPEATSPADNAAARTLLARFLEGFGSPAGRLDLIDTPAGALEVLNQTLGEGEVGIRVVGPREVRIQETVFAGVWRERHFDEHGALVHDWLSACPVPPIAIDAARSAASTSLAVPAPSPGTMNSPSLLHEIREQVRTRVPGAPAHVINLTLLPLSPQDQQLVDDAFAPGPVAMLSRGFGNCRIGSTAVRDVWRVQYFNNMQTLILNTLEVVDVPEVALAAAEDLEDSRVRLAELLDWMAQS